MAKGRKQFNGKNYSETSINYIILSERIMKMKMGINRFTKMKICLLNCIKDIYVIIHKSIEIV